MWRKPVRREPSSNTLLDVNVRSMARRFELDTLASQVSLAQSDVGSNMTNDTGSTVRKPLRSVMYGMGPAFACGRSEPGPDPSNTMVLAGSNVMSGALQPPLSPFRTPSLEMDNNDASGTATFNPCASLPPALGPQPSMSPLRMNSGQDSENDDETDYEDLGDMYHETLTSRKIFKSPKNVKNPKIAKEPRMIQESNSSSQELAQFLNSLEKPNTQGSGSQPFQASDKATKLLGLNLASPSAMSKSKAKSKTKSRGKKEGSGVDLTNNSTSPRTKYDGLTLGQLQEVARSRGMIGYERNSELLLHQRLISYDQNRARAASVDDLVNFTGNHESWKGKSVAKENVGQWEEENQQFNKTDNKQAIPDNYRYTTYSASNYSSSTDDQPQDRILTTGEMERKERKEREARKLIAQERELIERERSLNERQRDIEIGEHSLLLKQGHFDSLTPKQKTEQFLKTIKSEETLEVWKAINSWFSRYMQGKWTIHKDKIPLFEKKYTDWVSSSMVLGAMLPDNGGEGASSGPLSIRPRGSSRVDSMVSFDFDKDTF